MIQKMLEKSTHDPLLILRGIAMLMVVIYHVQFPHVYWYITIMRKIDLGAFMFSNGPVGTWIFFILSGYLIGKGFFSKLYTLSPKGIFIYFLRRLKKIVPLYYVTVVIVFFIVFPYDLRRDWVFLLRLLTFTANDLLTRPGVGYLWFISCLMQLYLIAPFIFIILRNRFIQKISPLYLMILIVLLGFMIRFVAMFGQNGQGFAYNWDILYTSSLGNIDFFAFGFVLNVFLRDNRLSGSVVHLVNTTHQRLLLAATGLIIFYALSSYIATWFYFKFTAYFYYQVFLLPVITLIVIGFYIILYESNYQEKQFQQRQNFQRLASYIGTLSYGIYLFHAPVMDKFLLHCGRPCYPQTFFIHLFIVLIASICLSYSVYSLWKHLVAAVGRLFLHHEHTSPNRDSSS